MATDKVQLNEKLDNFRDAWLELLEIWLAEEDGEVSTFLADGYPFDTCFNELHSDVFSWIEMAKTKVNE